MAKYTLMKHQKEGVKFLDSVDGIGALLFEPGTGKTGTTLTWVDRLTRKHPEVRVLVVAPLTAADTWVLQAPMFMDSVVKARMLQGSTLSIMRKIEQAHDWTTVPDSKIKVDHPGTKRAQVSGNRVTILSLSAGAVSSYCTDAEKTAAFGRAVRKYDPHLVVVDESHIIKSATANISKAMYRIGQLAPHRIILTGTVTPHSPLDVYGQWRFLAPWTFSNFYEKEFTKTPLSMTEEQRKSISPWPWTRFKDRYSMPGGWKGKGISGYRNQSQLNARIAERSMVVRKEDALDLPPVQDIDVNVALSPKEAKAYRQMKEELAAEIKGIEKEKGSSIENPIIEAPNALAKMMKLRQITTGFITDTETKEVHWIGRSKQKAVQEIVDVTLVGENRIVVFAYFKSECAALAKALQAKGRTVEIITGATKPNERLAIRQRFADVSGNPEQIVLVAQQRTMSVSVNELVTAQHAIYTSMSERRDDWVQSRGRLDRNGQKGSHVTFWNVLVPDTIDEVMLKNHKDRGNLEMALLNYIKNSR